MKKICGTLLVFSLLFAPFQANAQVVKSTSLVAAVKGKSLTLTAPASIAMGAIDVASEATETSGTMTGVTVEDLRGKKIPLGWSLTMTATDFKTIANDVIPVTQLKVDTSTYKFIKGKDGGISVPGIVSVADGNQDGTSDAISIMNASAGNGAGSFSVDPVIKLTIPAFSTAGDYQSTVTLTLL